MAGENNITKTPGVGSTIIEQVPGKTPAGITNTGTATVPTSAPVDPAGLKNLQGASRRGRFGVSGVFENPTAIRERDDKMNRLFEFGDSLVGGALGQVIPNHPNPAVRSLFPEYGRRP